MSDKISVDQYGRRSWNVDAYEKEAKTKKVDKEDVDISKALAIKDNTSSNSLVAHRNNLLESLLSAVKTYNIINPANAGGSYGREKRFGFFCPICSLSFRDNLALIDHLNSPQHVAKANQLSNNLESEQGELDGGIRRASLQQVIATIELLVEKLIRQKTKTSEGLTFQERVAKRIRFEDEKREKRKQKRRKKDTVEVKDDSEMASLLGISGFGSTKK